MNDEIMNYERLLSLVTYHLSLVTYHLSLITCHLSLVTYHLIQVSFRHRPSNGPRGWRPNQ